MIQPYASNPEHSRGRLIKEDPCNLRNIYQRDRDRILHSASFRRLEYKTQVFVYHENDHYRTRLTHSLEVAQIARTISRLLGGYEDLAEALALAHDMGHPPFGHAGEDGLNEVMIEFGGYDHNAQTIKILTELESRYPNFNGLNVTWETLEGVAKHNGPLIGKNSFIKNKNIHEIILSYDQKFSLELDKFSSLEAQIAALADDIAYNNHDIEDGLRAKLFNIDQLLELPLIGGAFKSTIDQYPNIENKRLIHQSISNIMRIMVMDVVTVTMENIKKYNIETSQDIRDLDCATVSFSQEMQQAIKALKKFLFINMYRHYKVNRMTSKARRIIKDLFTIFLNEPGCLPTEWQQKINEPHSRQAAIIVADYVSGMTDRFAFDEHKSLFGLY